MGINELVTGGDVDNPVVDSLDTDEISSNEQSSTPSTPPSGERKLYAKSNGFYELTSGGNESKVGGGGGISDVSHDYYLYNDSGTYRAKSDSYTDYSDSDFGTVLQNAYDTLDGEQAAESGGSIRLAPGTYTIDKSVSGAITIRTGVKLIGPRTGFNITADDGDWAYCRIETANFTAGDDLFTCPSTDNVPENAGFHDIYINPGGTDVIVFHLLNASGTHFERVKIEDCQGTGILNEGAKDSSAQGCQIQAGDLDNNYYSLDVKQSGLHGGQMLYNGTLDYVHCEGGNTLRIRGAGGLRSFVKGPASNTNPAAMVQIDGGAFVMSDAIVDGGNNSGLHGMRFDENTKLDNVTVQKVDKGIIQNSKGQLGQWDNLKVLSNLDNGIEISGSMPLINSFRIDGSGNKGLTVGNINATNQLVNGWFKNNTNAALDVGSLATGKRLRVRGVDFRGNGSQINGLSNVIFNGVAQESANAEEPQDSYRRGEVVDFTDTGDGSGSGLYRVLLDGTTFKKVG